MTKLISGGCLCGAVLFTVVDDFKKFYFCHCLQCRKMTGSAHAANLFTAPDNLTWLQGQELCVHYTHSGRAFTKVFCRNCGSGLPFLTHNGKFVVVPAGSLDEDPSKEPDSQIFCDEQTQWYKQGLLVKQEAKFPT